MQKKLIGGSWKAFRTYKNDEIKEKKGPDSRVFYVKDEDNIMGFFALFNQDYIDLHKYDRFISSVWVDPAYRGKYINF